MIREIQAKTMLSHHKEADPYFGIKYGMNLYRGCVHQCIYCDSRSECYGIENFSDVLVKVNAIPLLRKELSSKRVKGIVGTGSMNDPYQPVEKRYGLAGQALEAIAQFGFPVHVMTKSDLVLKDLDTLVEIARMAAYVSFTITAADDELAKKLEPGAPRTSRRLAAMRKLAEAGVHTGVSMMPILPLICDTVENVTAIVERAVESGASYVIPWFGMTMRDRQRAYFYAKLDELFPGMRPRYQRAYGLNYEATSPNHRALGEAFGALRARLGFDVRVPAYQPGPPAEQLTLF